MACNHLGLFCLVFLEPNASCIVCACRCVGHYYLFPLDAPQAWFVVPGGVLLVTWHHWSVPPNLPAYPPPGFAATVLGLVHWAWTPMHFPFVRRLTRWWVQPEWKRKIVIGVTTAKPELLPCTIFILHFCLCGCILDRCPWLEACNHLELLGLVYLAQYILHSVCLCRCVGHYYLFPLDAPQAWFVVPGGVLLVTWHLWSVRPCVSWSNHVFLMNGSMFILQVAVGITKVALPLVFLLLG